MYSGRALVWQRAWERGMDRKQSGRGPNNAPDGPRREGAGTPDDRASAADRHGGRDFRTRDWLFAAALVVAVFVAYQPAWQGGFIWDDDAHLLNNPVLEPGGLFRMWVPGTHINYWPLTWTAYRIQYQLWGLAPVGFHLVNIALHALSAILIWRILALMRVPGAGFAAALFALHPVNVESVAWISQLKNTLSLALTLLSVLLYLLSESRSRLPGGTLGARQTRLRQVPPGRRDLPRRDLRRSAATGGGSWGRSSRSAWRRWRKA